MATQINKRNSVFRTTVDAATGIAKFECIPTGDTFEVNVHMLATTIATEAMLHGLKQKINDAAATPAGSATIDERWAAMLAVRDRLTGDSPSWNAVASGGGERGPKLGVLLEAIMQLRGENMSDADTVEARRAWLESKTPQERTALERNPKLVPIIAEIRARRAKTTVDADALLRELED